MASIITGQISLGEILTVAISLIAAVLIAVQWLFRVYGRFELRFLDPDAETDPEKEKRSSVLRLLPGTSVTRISLRPRTHIWGIKRLSFTTFDNRNYPMRFLPGFTGSRRAKTFEILAKSLRWQVSDGGWGPWIDLKTTPRGSYWDAIQEFVEGSRQVMEVEYYVSPSVKNWDGVLGIVVQYEDGGNNRRRNLNSKFFTGSQDRTPLSFKFRRVFSSKPNDPHNS